MRSLLYVLSALTVMGLAWWAYQENFRTQQAIKQADRLQRDIGDMRQELAMLRAEWAYLNRPDRLRELAALNFDRLGLLPMLPAQFALIRQVSFPLPDLPAVTNAVDVVGKLESRP